MSKDLATIQREISWHEQIRRTNKDCLKHSLEIGKHLLTVKASLKHGEFEKWAKTNLHYGKTQTWRFMNLATEAAKRSACGTFDEETALLHVSRQLNRGQTRNPVETPDLPTGTYRTVVIDPPWPMTKIVRDVRPRQTEALDYPVMDIEHISALPVTTLFADGCHIYLWTTHKYLPDALRILEGWGARYECLLTWIKPVGMTPYSWMYSTEHVLFGRAGSLDLLVKGRRLDFTGKATGHSRKPDEFYALVRTVSPEPRLEMFSRTRHEGFDAWGTDGLSG